MNFFTKDELKILDRYPHNTPMSVKSYVRDFVFNNPLNFPIVPMLLKSCPKYITKIRNFYTEENLCHGLSRVDYENLFNLAYVNDCFSFTILLISMLSKYCMCTFKIVRRSPNIIINIINEYDYSLLIDKTASSIICYNNKQFPMDTIFQSSHFKTLKDAAENYKDTSFYYFELPGDDSNKILDLFGLLTGYFIKCFYHGDIKNSLFEKCRGEEPVSGNNNIFNHIKNHSENVTSYYIDNAVKDIVGVHTFDVIDESLLDETYHEEDD